MLHTLCNEILFGFRSGLLLFPLNRCCGGVSEQAAELDELINEFNEATGLLKAL